MKKKRRFENWLDRIVQAIESWVKTPNFIDPTLQRRAEIIHILSSMVLLMALAALSITPFVFTNQTYGISLTSVIIILSILVQVLNRMGRTHLAAPLFVIGIWIFDSGVILLSGGFQSQYLASYIIITVMAGLILGQNYAFQIGGLSVIAYLITYFLEVQEYLPEPVFVFTPIALIIIYIVNILLSATILVLVLTKYEENISTLSEKEESLSNINQKMGWEMKSRQEAETLLRQSEERLKSALMDSPYPTMLHTGNGEILLLNTAWTEKSGYNLTQLNTFPDWLDTFYRDSKDLVELHTQNLLSGNETHQESQLDLLTKDGNLLSWYVRWTRLPDLSDGRKLILTIATDMTDLINVESALRRSEEHLSKFTLVTNDGLWDWDLTTDEVDFDPRYYTMAGYEVDEFPHQLEEFRKRVHPDDVEKVFQQAEAHLQGEIDHFRVEFRYQKKDGSWLWVMGRGAITEQDNLGNPIRLVGTHTDISAQKEIEMELSDHQIRLEQIVEERTRSLNERIAEVERLNAALTNILDDYQTANEKLTALSSNLSYTFQELESVTYSLSNGLKDPVLSIINSADQLISNPSQILKKIDLEKLRAIYNNAALIDQRINVLLEISHLNRQTLDLKPVKVLPVVEEAVDYFAEQLNKKQIDLEITDLPICIADRNLLERVFRILIDNAIKFTEAGQNLKISIGSHPGETPEKVVYYIQDKGIGFKIEDQETIFQTFQQLSDQDNQGAGIGLSIAKIIISKHGGEIWAEAEEGSGATFFFELSRPEAVEYGPQD